MNEQIFVKELKKLNIEVDPEKLTKLKKYCDFLIEENKKYNLTTIANPEEIYLKHFFDSLTATLAFDFNQEIKCIDIGTGAGFPGLVLKIFFPNINLTLLDSNNKKIKFLNKLTSLLEINDVTLINERSEEYAKQNQETYDLVISRAVAALPILLEVSLPLLKINANFLALKANAKEEIKSSKEALTKLNSSVEKEVLIKLPVEESTRTLILIKKEFQTDSKYPRQFDKIKKKPL